MAAKIHAIARGGRPQPLVDVFLIGIVVDVEPVEGPAEGRLCLGDVLQHAFVHALCRWGSPATARLSATVSKQPATLSRRERSAGPEADFAVEKKNASRSFSAQQVVSASASSAGKGASVPSRSRRCDSATHRAASALLRHRASIVARLTPEPEVMRFGGSPGDETPQGAGDRAWPRVNGRSGSSA